MPASAAKCRSDAQAVERNAGNWRDAAHKPVVPDTPPLKGWLDSAAGPPIDNLSDGPAMVGRRGHGGTAIIVW